MANLLELMENVGSRDTKKVLRYLDDAFVEMQSVMPDKVYTTYISVVDGDLYYDLPTTMIDLLSVSRKYDDSTSIYDTRYIPINETLNVGVIKEESS